MDQDRAITELGETPEPARAAIGFGRNGFGEYDATQLIAQV
jgi:hypothetical protein